MADLDDDTRARLREQGFDPDSDPTKLIEALSFTSIIGRCQSYSWPWHEGLTDQQIRRIVLSGEGPRQLPIGLVLIDGGTDG